MKIEDVRTAYSEQMVEVTSAIMALFDTTDIRDIGEYTMVVSAIMCMPRPQRQSVGIGIVEDFFANHAIDVESKSERESVKHHIPLILWSIRAATDTLTTQAHRQEAVAA